MSIRGYIKEGIEKMAREGHSLEEIANLLNLNPATVKRFKTHGWEEWNPGLDKVESALQGILKYRGSKDLFSQREEALKRLDTIERLLKDLRNEIESIADVY